MPEVTEHLLRQLGGIPKDKILTAYLEIQNATAKMVGQINSLILRIQVGQGPNKTIKELEELMKESKASIALIIDDITREIQ